MANKPKPGTKDAFLNGCAGCVANAEDKHSFGCIFSDELPPVLANTTVNSSDGWVSKIASIEWENIPLKDVKIGEIVCYCEANDWHKTQPDLLMLGKIDSNGLPNPNKWSAEFWIVLKPYPTYSEPYWRVKFK